MAAIHCLGAPFSLVRCQGPSQKQREHNTTLFDWQRRRRHPLFQDINKIVIPVLNRENTCKTRRMTRGTKQHTIGRPRCGARPESSNACGTLGCRRVCLSGRRDIRYKTQRALLLPIRIRHQKIKCSVHHGSFPGVDVLLLRVVVQIQPRHCSLQFLFGCRRGWLVKLEAIGTNDKMLFNCGL